MSLPLVLIPAYGRTYTTAAAAKADWLDGLDFRIMDGPYTSCRDAQAIQTEHGGANIYWRYPLGDSFPMPSPVIINETPEWVDSLERFTESIAMHEFDDQIAKARSNPQSAEYLKHTIIGVVKQLRAVDPGALEHDAQCFLAWADSTFDYED